MTDTLSASPAPGDTDRNARWRPATDPGRMFAALMKTDPEFELEVAAPGLVCFRVAPHGLDAGQLDVLNAELLERVNATAEVLLASERRNDRYVLRLTLNPARHTESDVCRSWDVVRDAFLGIVVDRCFPCGAEHGGPDYRPPPSEYSNS